MDEEIDSYESKFANDNNSVGIVNSRVGNKKVARVIDMLGEWTKLRWNLMWESIKSSTFYFLNVEKLGSCG